MRRFAASVLGTMLVFVLSPSIRAHDDERTRVVLSLAADGSFVLDLSHDPNWLLLRLESFAGALVPVRVTEAERDRRLAALGAVMIDRVVLWVDGREVRPASAEYLADARLFRLRGAFPQNARTLRWLYGAVGDTYPLVVRRVDGRTAIELIDGSHWSSTINLAGQFRRSTASIIRQVVPLLLAFAATLAWRLQRSRENATAPP